VEAVGNTQGLYLHLLLAHLHTQIKELGDLRPMQTQGLEHCNKIRKRLCLESTNRKEGQRTPTIMKCTILADWVRKQEKHEEDAKEHEDNKKARARRAVAKVERCARKWEVKIL
jgi:hypothetical protein